MSEATVMKLNWSEHNCFSLLSTKGLKHHWRPGDCEVLVVMGQVAGVIHKSTDWGQQDLYGVDWSWFYELQGPAWLNSQKNPGPSLSVCQSDTQVQVLPTRVQVWEKCDSAKHRINLATANPPSTCPAPLQPKLQLTFAAAGALPPVAVPPPPPLAHS